MQNLRLGCLIAFHFHRYAVVFHVEACQTNHFTRHGRGEQQRLSLFRKEIDDGFHLLNEAHIQHLIRLIKYQVAYLVKFHCPFLQMIQNPARGADYDMAFLSQFRFLRIEGSFAEDSSSLNPLQPSDVGDVLFHLQSQLPCRNQNQRLRTVFLPAHTFAQRYAETDGLAATGLRFDNDIFAL